jgi:hypothetical protein
MPVIKVSCLPKAPTQEETEAQLCKLHVLIVDAVTSVKELGLTDENDMTCVFSADQMQFGLGRDIIVEVSGLLVKAERTLEVRQRLAARLGIAVKTLYPKPKVEVFVQTFNPKVDAFWTSAS